MRSFWSFFVCLALVLGLGLAQAPRPCLGGGHGEACSLQSCRCDGTCTCKLEHAAEAEARAVADAAVCQPGMKRQAVAASCHQRAHGLNFAAPMKHWTALLPALPPAFVVEALAHRTAAPAGARRTVQRPLLEPPRPRIAC